MTYFIPAWYNDDTWWHSRYVPFYMKKKESEFDEIISLMTMYYIHGKNLKINILNYSPDLRLFLHRHMLYEVPYWSLFDEIQGFPDIPPFPLDYKDFDWPEATEFIFTPYIINCFTSKDTRSTIHYNEEGYLLWIEEYRHELKKKRFVFDDRGFLSSIIDYDRSMIQYMTIQGDCILTEDLKTKNIHVTSNYQSMFARADYHDMSEVIEEKLRHYIAYDSKAVRYIAASDNRHNHLISKVIDGADLTYSIFSRRNNDERLLTKEYLKVGEKWIVDSIKNELKMQSELVKYNMDVRTLRITPFSAIHMPNISSQLFDTEIALWLDNIDEEYVLLIMEQLTNYISSHEKTKIILMSRRPLSSFSSLIQQQIDAVNEQLIEIDPEDERTEEELLDDAVVRFKHVPFENDIVEALSSVRLIIDLGQEPKLFIQISAISAGIPQINLVTTDYVHHRLNGYVINQQKELDDAIDYFIVQLKNWNQSYAYCVKLIEQYSSENILRQLELFIEGENNGKKV